ncbi:MAG: photosynthetic complex assembly protein PuhC [Thiohalocapsa sp.]|jgi:putative photosynthetic complex assembly protein
MSDPFEGRPFPREVLIGAALLIGFVIVATATVRVTGIGGTELVTAEPVESRQLVFVENPDGTTDVRVPGTSKAIARLRTQDDGFVLGVLRGMVRERKSYDADLDAPYLLSLRADGSLLFEDPSTSRRIDLRAFGPTNFGAFAELLRAEIQLDPPTGASGSP